MVSIALLPLLRSEYPTPGKQSKAIKKMHETLDIDHMRAFLTKFSGFRTRYYRSETGKQSQHFLYQTIQEVSTLHSGRGWADR
jgi:leucyl aminopeptidase